MGPFVIRESQDGHVWTSVSFDTVYLSAYKTAEARSRTSTLPRFQQVFREYDASEPEKSVALVTFVAGRFHYFDREQPQ